MNAKDIDRILAEQSAELLEAMKQGEAGARENLSTFLRESPRNVRHYLRGVAVDRELAHIDPERKWEIRRIQNVPASNVVALSEGARADGAGALDAAPKSPRRLLWSIAAAFIGGVLLLLAAERWLPEFVARGHQYATGVGEQRAVELKDGSVVVLNTQSRLVVRYTEEARVIHLEAGEALFKVHRDPLRPFRVYTPDAMIQAVGTQFNVHRRPEGTTVAVLEGRVRVDSALPEEGLSAPTPTPAPAPAEPAANQPARASEKSERLRTANLAAGQQARISHSGAIATETAADPSNLAAWRQRRLIFRSTPLAEMVAEFNRYNRVPRFVLADSNASTRPYSGIFDADDPDSLIQLLQGEPGILLERRGNEVFIREDHEAGSPVLAESPP